MTDATAMGTKDGTSVVTPKSALKEAVERDIEVIGNVVGFYCGNKEHDTWQRIKDALATQTATLEAMASALMAWAYYDGLTDSDGTAMMIAYDIALEKTRQALNQEQPA